jgi:hypothetical protein
MVCEHLADGLLTPLNASPAFGLLFCLATSSVSRISFVDGDRKRPSKWRLGLESSPRMLRDGGTEFWCDQRTR